MVNISEMQAQVEAYDERFGWDKDKVCHVALHIMEELGEVSRRILRYEGYKKEEFNQKELAEELTDMLYLTLKLANKFDIDLDEEWAAVEPRYEKKKDKV